MDYLDKLFDDLNDALDDFSLSKKTVAEINEEKLEQEFSAKLEAYLNDDSLEAVVGKYDDIGTESGAREVNINTFIDECVKLTKEGVYKEDHVLHMNSVHAKHLKQEAAKMFNYIETIMLKTSYDDVTAYDVQAYLNERSVGNRGQNTESTMQGIKAKIHKINLLESIARGKAINYSSNIKTTSELEEFKHLKKSKVAKDDDDRNKQMSSSDYKKVFDSLFEKLQNNPTSVTESEAAFLLAGEFGLRISSILKLNVNQVNVKAGTIELECEQNKSKQMFVAKSDFSEPNNFVSTQLLSALRQRASLLYSPDKNEDMKLINCSEQNLHKGFSSIMKKHNLNQDKYQGKYKTLRHRFAQNMYDQVRSELEHENLTLNEKKTRAIKEVNYLLGHETKKISTTMRYIKNIW